MISNIVLLGATGLLGYGYYNFKKEGKLVRLFDELIKIETYDVDYVSNFNELPQDKDIVIQGTILHNKENNIKKVSITDNEIDVVYNELIGVTQQVEESETDFYYNSSISQSIKFSIGESNDINKQIHFDFIPKQISFYNPYKVKENIDTSLYSSQLSLIQKVKFGLFKKSYNVTEFALVPNSTFSFIGRITPVINNNSTSYRFIPKVIMSDNKDYLLQHLDRYLVALNQKGKKFLGIGMGIFGFHFAITKIIFAKPQNTELPE